MSFMYTKCLASGKLVSKRRKFIISKNRVPLVCDNGLKILYMSRERCREPPRGTATVVPII